MAPPKLASLVHSRTMLRDLLISFFTFSFSPLKKSKMRNVRRHRFRERSRMRQLANLEQWDQATVNPVAVCGPICPQARRLSLPLLSEFIFSLAAWACSEMPEFNLLEQKTTSETLSHDCVKEPKPHIRTLWLVWKSRNVMCVLHWELRTYEPTSNYSPPSRHVFN